MHIFKKSLAAILTIAMLLSFTVIFAAESFVDTSCDTTANTAIATLSAKGILFGYPDGTFKPDRTISRAEFAEDMMLLKEIAHRVCSLPEYNPEH